MVTVSGTLFLYPASERRPSIQHINTNKQDHGIDLYEAAVREMARKPELECTAKIEIIFGISLRIDEKQPGTSKFIFPLSLPSKPRSMLSSLYAQNSSYPPSLSNIKPSMNPSPLSLTLNPEKRYLFQITLSKQDRRHSCIISLSFPFHLPLLSKEHSIGR
jgi:hypothetical protein